MSDNLHEHLTLRFAWNPGAYEACQLLLCQLTEQEYDQFEKVLTALVGYLRVIHGMEPREVLATPLSVIIDLLKADLDQGQDDEIGRPPDPVVTQRADFVETHRFIDETGKEGIPKPPWKDTLLAYQQAVANEKLDYKDPAANHWKLLHQAHRSRYPHRYETQARSGPEASDQGQ